MINLFFKFFFFDDSTWSTKSFDLTRRVGKNTFFERMRRKGVKVSGVKKKKKKFKFHDILWFFQNSRTQQSILTHTETCRDACTRAMDLSQQVTRSIWNTVAIPLKVAQMRRISTKYKNMWCHITLIVTAR